VKLNLERNDPWLGVRHKQQQCKAKYLNVIAKSPTARIKVGSSRRLSGGIKN
jgi:hypothetical protein